MIDKLKKIFESVDIIRFATAFTVMFSFFIIVNALIYREIPVENVSILIHVLGIIEGAFMAIVSYEFGSSKGSKQKTDLLGKKPEDILK